jgi:hypothetical protein
MVEPENNSVVFIVYLFSVWPYSLTLIYIQKKSGLTGLTLEAKRRGRL